MAWVNEVYDKLYAPNTVCVACISHGKDSLAMLRAIKLLGLPLHRIVTTDVWATQDIPADLPPMWEWKKKADKIIKELYGIEVEHLCAMAREESNEVAQTDRQTDGSLTKQCSTSGWKAESSKETLKDSRKQLEHGAKKSNTKKLTYEDIFYRRYKEGRKEGRIYGFPHRECNWCNSMLKVSSQERNIRIPYAKGKLVYNLPQANHTAFRSPSDKVNGVKSSSSFPKAPRMRGKI